MVRKKKCGELIKQINDELRKNANNEMRSQGLTATQANTLVELYYAPEQQLSMKDLEERLHVAQSTVVGIVSRLEQKKLVESFSHSSDKRIKLVRITQAGAENVLKAEQDMMLVEQRFLSGLTETEQSILYTLLTKVRDTLK